jgi:hypothetical protein
MIHRLFDSATFLLQVIRMGVAPVRIEVLNEIDGVSFPNCFKNRRSAGIESPRDAGSITLFFTSPTLIIWSLVTHSAVGTTFDKPCGDNRPQLAYFPEIENVMCSPRFITGKIVAFSVYNV